LEGKRWREKKERRWMGSGEIRDHEVTRFATICNI
jgi:hypothetical protein